MEMDWSFAMNSHTIYNCKHDEHVNAHVKNI